jgi:pilus assembly protein CpaF
MVVDRVLGLGPIEPLLVDPRVTDILINGPFEVWVDRGGALERTAVQFEDGRDLMTTIDRAISALGLRIDRSSPVIDARLPDGSRLHAAIPPAAVDSPIVAIRRFSRAVESFEHFVASRSATRSQVEFLQKGVHDRKTTIVSGGTGAGKTTLLNLLAGSIPFGERVVTVEDAAELRFGGHVVRLEARPPNAEASGEITIRQLLRSALRLRPDRIVLGEVRGPEALDLITALNTGHEGSMSTVHANSPQEAMWRLETLALLDGVASPEAVTRQLYSAVDHVVQMSRSSGRRVITSIAQVAADGSVDEVSLG